MKRRMLTTLSLVVCLTPPAALNARAQTVPQKEEPVVLGAEGLKAAEAEARRKGRGDTGKSPMPAGGYRFSREELGLVNPRPNELDAALSDLARRYAQSDAPTRARMRNAIDMEQLYTLLEFANRSAVFALRERSAARLADGFAAVAMVEMERVDYRDIPWALATLHHAAARVGASPEKLSRDAAALAGPGTAGLVLDFLKQPAKARDLRDAWGRVEVETEGGVGLMGWGFEKYEPTLDLKRVAVDTARLVAADRYVDVSARVAEGLPRHWLETNDNAALDRALRKVRAGASVNGSLAPGAHPQHDDQMFVVFLAELEDEAAARALLDIAQKKRPATYGMLALAEGRLFCLLVARSFTVGVGSVETNESVRRFSEGLAEVMRRHVRD